MKWSRAGSLPWQLLGSWSKLALLGLLGPQLTQAAMSLDLENQGMSQLVARFIYSRVTI